MRQSAAISDSYLPDFPALAVDLPTLYEDEGQEHMGETTAHTHASHTSYSGLLAHFADKTEYRVFANLSLYYHPVNRAAYVSPDTMVVCPSRPLDTNIASYRVGHDGPAPLMVVEVLGRRSLQQHDLTIKPLVYAQLGVKELLFVDTTGEILTEKLQLRRLQLRDETWMTVVPDESGMLTSAFGFAVTIEPDGKLRFSNLALKQKAVPLGSKRRTTSSPPGRSPWRHWPRPSKQSARPKSRFANSKLSCAPPAITRAVRLRCRTWMV